MEEFDYVVVGSGSAGGVLAARLTENPAVSVLLLEAGPGDDDDAIHMPGAFGSLFKTRWDWNYATEPQKAMGGREVYWPRMKALGGCSSLNAMIYIRGNSADYDEWETEYGVQGWSYDDVLPYFRKAEANQRLDDFFHGTDGPLRVEDPRRPHDLSLAFVESCVEHGLARNPDFNGEGQNGCGLYQLTCHNGRRWSVADAYIHPASTRDNLTVRTGAHATRVMFDGTRAVGVEYRRHGELRVAHSSTEVILSAGALNSPHLLMLSGIGPGDHLRRHGIRVRADSPGVGQHLQDHPIGGALFETRGVSDLIGRFNVAAALRWQLSASGPFASNIVEAGAFLSTTGAGDLPDIQIHFIPAAFIENGLHEYRHRGLTIGPALVRVESEGAVTLHSADPTWRPSMNPNYFEADEDLEAMITAMDHVTDIATASPLAQYIKAPLIPPRRRPSRSDIVNALRDYGQSLYHPVGTCGMGQRPDSVVDSKLLVNGVSHLRVVDASVIPRVPRGNTNAPTIMIAEKAADIIKEQQ